MAGFVKRSLDEILTRYLLEPEIADVYVEGPFDRSVVEWVLVHNCNLEVSVYEISTVEINAPLGGNKDRVITLASYLADNLDDADYRICCVIDADFDYICGSKVGCRFLYYTDYSCMESYYFDERFFRKFSYLYFLDSDFITDETLENFSIVLAEAFLIRLGKSIVCPDVPWVEITRSLKKVGETISLDSKKYYNRLMISGGAKGLIPDLVVEIERWRTELPSDPRYHIHGHDLVDVVSWYARKCGKGNKLSNKCSIGRGLVTNLEAAEMMREKLFLDLVAQLGN